MSTSILSAMTEIYALSALVRSVLPLSGLRTGSKREKALPYREHRGTKLAESDNQLSVFSVPLCSLYGDAFSFSLALAASH
ncbi:MAG: hypothetical protein WBQ66_00625, partial [Blastocatellia bacterium]